MIRRLILSIFACFIFGYYSAQDTCATASDEDVLGCGEAITVNFNPGDTEDPVESVGCMIGENGTWYYFQTDPLVLEFEISGGTYNLFRGPDCSSLTEESDCGSPGTITADPAVIYYILVADNATVSTAAFTNDDCDGAVSDGTINCGDILTASGDPAACTDSEAIGCMDELPGVWYEFTTDVDLPSFEVSGSDFELFEGSCGNLTQISDCGSPLSITADPAETYYLLVSGSVTVEAEPSPPNDFCGSATELSSGTDQVTCCGAIENLDECGGSAAGVWFTYSPGDVAVSFSFSNIDMSGSIGIEIYSGADCSALTFEDSYCGGPTSITFDIPACNDDFFIHVTSSQGDCGSFTLTGTDVAGCSFAETCDDVSDTMMPSSGGGQVCLGSCTESSCGGVCAATGVWFSVETDDIASVMEVIVNNASFDPVVSIYQGEDCGSLTGLVLCETPDVGEITAAAVNAMQTYFIEVGSENGPGGSFDLCVLTDIAQVQCSSGDIEPSRPEYPDEDPNGPYCPGETVNFCYEVDFTVDPIGQGNNCQWIQGILPTIGGGWDLSVTPLDIQGPEGGWFWLDEGNVDHNVDSPVLELISTPNGLGLEYGNGGLSAGDLLPGGWWYTSPGGGSGCTNDGDPDTMWGLPAGCGSSSSVEFCFDLTVQEIDDPADCSDEDFTDLKVHIFTMADGQTGCWSNNSCAGDVPVVFDALMDCTSVVEVLAEDTEICSEGSVDILVETSDGSSADIIVEVIEEGNTSGAQDWVFNGTGVIPDVIENDGSDVEVVIYEAYALSPPSVCKGPITTIEVIVYPEVFIDPDDPYYICFGVESEIEPLIEGGTGGPYDVEWSNGDTGNSVTLPENIDAFPGEYEITMFVTDDLGCTAEKTIDYEIIEPVIPTIIKDAGAVCKDGVDDMISMTLDFMDVGTGPYEFQWDSNPVGLDFQGADDEITIIIDDENSASRNYTVIGIVIDDYGCEYRAETNFIVDNGPGLEFAIDECFGIGYELIGFNTEIEQVTFDIYYDEDGDWNQQYETLIDEELVAGPILGNQINYFAEDFGFYILVGTSANGCREFFILEVPPLALPVFLAMPNDTVCAGTTVTISVVNVLDYVEFDWSTGSNFDTTIVTPLDTTTYYLEVELENGCEVIDSILIVVNPIPDVIITGSSSFCPGSFATLSAQGPASSQYVWTGPNNETINTQSAQIDVPGIWNIQITSDAGCINFDNVDVIQDDQLDPQIVGGNFCSGETVTLDGGLGFDTYEWIDDNSNIVGTESTLEVDVAGLYTLNVILGNCDGSDAFAVMEIQPLPDALNADQAAVCNVDSGSLPTFLNLTTFEIGTVSGTWFNENGIPVIDPTFVDFTNEITGIVNYTFETSGAEDPCENDTYNFAIDIMDCACPNVAINAPGNFCVGIDTFDLTLIQITTEEGNWSINSTDIEILNDSLLITNSTTPAGSYTLTYSLENVNIPPSCPTSNSVDFSINSEPEAIILEDASVCNLDTGNGADFIDLDDLYVSGATGDWTSSDLSLSIDVDNVVSFTNQALGNYTFFYLTNDAQSPCQNINYTSIISVIDCTCPTLELDPLDQLCSSGGSLDLTSFLNNPESEPGNWSIDGPDNSVLVGNTINPTDAPAGIYTITFTFNSPIGGSCISEISQNLTIIDPPTAMINQQVIACNGTNISAFPVNIDLTTVVTGFPGFWTAPQEYNNGVIDDETNVNFEGVDPGIYLFTYSTNSAEAPCQDIDIILNLEVVNCNCPVIAFNTPTPLCNDNDETNLNSLLFPSVNEGSWIFVDGPENLIITQDSLFSVNNIAEGQYTFEYTLTEMVPSGCLGSSQITLEVYQTPDVSITPTAIACNTVSIQGPNCLDLNSFVIGATGTWNAPVNYTGDFSDISNICFDGLDVGSSYEFTFLTNTAVSPCVDKSLTTTVSIIDCNCPNIAISTPPSLCDLNGTMDLSSLEDPNIIEGSWSVVDGPQSINITGNEINTNGVLSGIYTLQYTPIDQPPTDCDQFSQVELEVVQSPSAGQGTEISVCINDDELVDLYGLLENEDSGGLWLEISSVMSTGSAFDSQGTFETTDQNVGRYEFQYLFNSIDPCEDVFSNVTIVIEDLPIANAGEDQLLDCSNTIVGIGSSSSSSGTNFRYEWVEQSGITIVDSDQLLIDVEQAGTYSLQVQDVNTGCISFDEVVVTVDTDLPSFGTDIQDSPCFGQNAGAIIISSVQGGDGNYLYSIDGGLSWSDQTQFAGLAPGTYTVMLQDGNGCVATQSGIIILEPGPLSLDTGEDRDVEYGDEFYTLQIAASIDPSLIESIVWTENGIEICTGDILECGIIQVNPAGVATYCATITDINGCVAEDCVILRERVVRDVYIPNVFSPGSSDNNSKFFVSADDFVISVEEFRIFDRWGEMVFQAPEGHAPNESEFGWDGTFEERPVEQGVYVYVIKVNYDNNTSQVFAGDITLIK